MWLLALLKGILVGICASIPLGPVGVICVQQTVNRGRRAGFASGYGAAVADTLFASVAFLSLSVVLDFIDAHRQAIQVSGGVLLIVLGFITFVRNAVKQFRKDRASKKKNYAQDFVYVFLLTLTNPLTVFIFLTLFAAFGMHNAEGGGGLWILIPTLVGVHLGATSWWYMLTYTVSRFQSFFRLRQVWWFNKIAGVVIMLLGVLMGLYPFLGIRG
ncbi:MAG: LysE family translocator [Bacteroides sp.]